MNGTEATRVSAVSLLYVEDDPDAREALGRVISANFPTALFFTAENGEAGLEMFRAHGPDIVLTDISMPVVNGIEMARKILELDADAKIIAVTARNRETDLLDAINNGIKRYVLKPVDLDALFQAIEDCLALVASGRQKKTPHEDRSSRQNPELEQQLNKELERLNGELEQLVLERTLEMQATKEELEAFCYSIAHDLSTPLRSMSCFSSIMMEEHSDNLSDAGKEYLRRIGSASVRMGQLIDDLLHLSRVTRSELRRERVDLSAFAHDIVGSFRARQPEGGADVAIEEDVAADGDPVLLRPALENLLDNAWKFAGGEPLPRVEFGSKSQQGETVYFVRDNGIGFDMAYAAKIFLPFERLHRVGEFAGTGVGLATVQRIVARHGGRVWATGEEGKGATFFFTLRAAGHFSND